MLALCQDGESLPAFLVKGQRAFGRGLRPKKKQGMGLQKKRRKFVVKAPFDVLLVTGASGTGKTSIAYQLSDYYKINVVQVDDFQCLVEKATKESDYPVFHYWKNHFEEAIRQPFEKKLEIMISYADQLSFLMEDIISNHLEENRPMIMEGDFISISLCKKFMEETNNGRVKALLIKESSKEQIVQNYSSREGRPQHDRAELSLRYNNWLGEQAKGTRIAAVDARPWDTLPQRSISALARKK